jgi:hypothetical protein
MSMHKTKVGASKMGTVKTGGNPRDGIAQNRAERQFSMLIKARC